MNAKELFATIVIFALCSFKPIDRIEQPHVIRYAQQSHSECGIPASIVLAQALIESGAGTSDLAQLSNNWFGIKAYKNWKGTTCGNYRSYRSVSHSFEDHALFLHDAYINAVGKDWNYWVKHCKGYGGAGYWQHVGKIIEQHKLYKYDL